MDAKYKHLIAVQINAVENDASALAFPEHNVIGSNILSELFTASLKAAHLEGQAFMDGQPLNVASFVIGVNDLKAALPVIKEALRSVHLLNWALIDWLTPDDILHPYHPEPTEGRADLNELVASNEAIAMKRDALRTRAGLCALLNQIRN